MAAPPVAPSTAPAWPSPNFGARRDGLRPELVVLHYTVMPDCAAARDRLCDPSAEVSAHWLIDRDGRTEALVPEEARAWHAGAGEWRGRGDVNSRSIGIELVNTGVEPFPEPQMAALERLLAGIRTRWGIGAEGVIGHSDMAPARKSDPGARFDWRRLARQGLAVWPGSLPRAEPAGRPEEGTVLPAPDARSVPAKDVDAAAFLAALAAFGYPQADPAALLSAFRLRFRPGARGPLDTADLALARGLQISAALVSPPSHRPMPKIR